MSTYGITLIDINDRLQEIFDEIEKLRRLVNPQEKELMYFFTIQSKVFDSMIAVDALNGYLPVDRANMELS